MDLLLKLVIAKRIKEAIDLVEKLPEDEIQELLTKNKDFIVSENLVGCFVDLLMCGYKVDSLVFMAYTYDRYLITNYVITSCLAHGDNQLLEYWIQIFDVYVGEYIPGLIRFSSDSSLVLNGLNMTKSLDDFEYHFRKLLEMCCIDNKSSLLRTLINEYDVSTNVLQDLVTVSCQFDSVNCLEVLSKCGLTIDFEHLKTSMLEMSPKCVKFIINKNYATFEDLPLELPLKSLFDIFYLLINDKEESRRVLNSLLNVKDKDLEKLKLTIFRKCNKEAISIWKKLLDVEDRTEPVRDL